MASPAKILGRERKPIPASAYANVQAFVPTAPGPIEVPRPAEREHELRLKRKADQACRVLDAITEEIAEVQACIKDLGKRKAMLDRRYAAIEDRIIAEMQQGGFTEFRGVRAELALRNAPEALVVEDATLIPEDYIRETISTAPDKVAIKAAMKRGEEIPGCSLTQKVTLCRK